MKEKHNYFQPDNQEFMLTRLKTEPPETMIEPYHAFKWSQQKLRSYFQDIIVRRNADTMYYLLFTSYWWYLEPLMNGK